MAAVVPASTGNRLLFTRFDRRIDWKHPDNAHNNFEERLASAFLYNHWCSDVSFYIPSEDQTIPAHAFIVATASPVLERFCFDTDGVPNVNNQFTMPDYCTTETIAVVLRYLYTGYTPGLHETNAASVLLMADFLDLPNLRYDCCEFICDELSTENVCEIFNKIHILQTDANKICLEFMDKNANAVMQNGTAMEMSTEALQLFLSRDSAHIANEFDLVAPFVNWANAECTSRGIKENKGRNRRLVLGKRVNLIRFAAMKHEQFMECTKLFGKHFFTFQEARAITHIIDKKREKLKCSFESQFSSRPRTGLVLLDDEIELGEEFGEELTNTLLLDLTRVEYTFALVGLTFLNDRDVLIRNLNDSQLIKTYIDSNRPSDVMFLQAVYPNDDNQIKLELSRKDKKAFITRKVLSSYCDIVQNPTSCVYNLFSQELNY